VREAENILTPYDFGVYDLLVLLPSFPYGGMYVISLYLVLMARFMHHFLLFHCHCRENACLTFVTPSMSFFRSQEQIPFVHMSFDDPYFFHRVMI